MTDQLTPDEIRAELTLEERKNFDGMVGYASVHPAMSVDLTVEPYHVLALSRRQLREYRERSGRLELLRNQLIKDGNVEMADRINWVLRSESLAALLKEEADGK